MTNRNRLLVASSIVVCLAVLLGIALAARADTPQAAAKASPPFEADDAMVEGCKFLGTYIGNSTIKSSLRNAYTDARLEAAELAPPETTHHVVLTAYGGMVVVVKAYDCSAHAKQGTP